MTSVLNRLNEELDIHLALYQRLLADLDREKNALLKRDLEALHESVQGKTGTAQTIQASLGRLGGLIDLAALELGLAAEPRPLLAALAKAAPESFSRDLARKAGLLVRLKNSLTLKNTANRVFISEALSLVNGSVAILTGAKRLKGAGYTAEGVEAKPAHTQPVKLSREI